MVCDLKTFLFHKKEAWNREILSLLFPSFFSLFLSIRRSGEKNFVVSSIKEGRLGVGGRRLEKFLGIVLSISSLLEDANGMQDKGKTSRMQLTRLIFASETQKTKKKDAFRGERSFDGEGDTFGKARANFGRGKSENFPPKFFACFCIWVK
jgi:hypothetical protein